MQDVDKRLIELEIKISYQEDLIQELNAIVCAQQKKIAQLGESFEVLNDRIKELSASTPGSLVESEKPPHY
jgi:SlyX protein